MPDFDPYQLDRPAPRTETRTFTDPAHPAVALTLTVSVSDEAPSKMRVYKRIADNQAEYIEGRLDPDAPLVPGGLPGRFAPAVVRFRKPGQESVIALEDRTCRFISVLQMLEVREANENGTAPPEKSVEYWAAVAVTLPTAFLDAGMWASTLLDGPPAEEQAADPTPAHTADLSE